jgi:hypothetical protein
MVVPVIKQISQKEFDEAESIYKIISDEIMNTHVCFELHNKIYYVGYSSCDIIKVDLMLLEKERYLLIGVDLKVVVLSIKTGSILFVIGLFSCFKGFENTNELTFTVFSELEDFVINKNGLSISQIIPHELEF